MHRLRLLIIVIGIFCGPLTYAVDEVPENEDGGSLQPGMVIVEPTNISNFVLKPYRERRRRWGGTMSVSYSTYEPIRYEPDFAPPGEFADVYHVPDLPLVDLMFSVKRNFDFGSVGVEFGAGFYKNRSDDLTLSDSTIDLTPVRVGGVFYLDTLSKEPYVVPYGSAGAYMVIYKESLGTTAKNGSTQPAPYITAGVQFQLDWIDRKAARISYEDSHIESSFVLLGVRKLFASSAESDPDLSNDISYDAGLRVEF